MDPFYLRSIAKYIYENYNSLAVRFPGVSSVISLSLCVHAGTSLLSVYFAGFGLHTNVIEDPAQTVLMALEIIQICGIHLEIG